jgi:CGNR zinc finger
MYLAGMSFDALFESVNFYGESPDELRIFRQLLESIAREQPIPSPIARSFSEILARAHSFRRLSPSPKPSDAPQWSLVGVPRAERKKLEFSLLIEQLLSPTSFRRIKLCSAPWCNGLFLDLSKNLSRHWCLQPGCEQRRKQEKARKHYDKNRRVK